MARSRIKPQFTTATRNNSSDSSKGRTTTQQDADGRRFSFTNKLSGSPSTIDQQHVEFGGQAESSSGFKALTYPAFGNASDGGHAIVFKINKTVRGRGSADAVSAARKGLRARTDKKTEAAVAKAFAEQGKNLSQKALSGDVLTSLFSPNSSQSVSNDPTLQGTDRHHVSNPGESANLGAPKKRLDTAIVLYMPPQIQTTYGLNYTDVDLGFAAQAMAGVFDVMGGNEAKVNAEQVTSYAKKAALTALNTVAPGATAALQIRMGAVISNKMELSFTGVNRREFQFVFNFTPKSEAEANTIRDIITTFKFYAHPSFLEGTGGNMMTIPDSFDIEYRSHGKHNQYLHKISTCFCTGINVQYGGDRFTAHKQNDKGAPPSKTILTLTFKEMELITKTRIGEGY